MASVQDRQEGIIVKLFDLVHEADSYQPPELSVGDRILKGKFKNSPAEITGFTQDKHNQPVLKTDRGEVQLFKPRVVKLMDKDVAESLDNPYPRNWNHNPDNDWRQNPDDSTTVIALATLNDGTVLAIRFQKDDDDRTGPGDWSVEFARNRSQEVTGEGDEKRIFATVLVATQEFVTWYKPDTVTFSASKKPKLPQLDSPAGTRVNPQSRAKLYNRMVQRYASAAGYSSQQREDNNKITYLLQRKTGVAEGSENNNTTAQKIFFARSNKTPKGWSYDHVGFITQDGKQIQMSGHKGNDVYVTNDVTDDPEFPKQNIKIVSLSKPVSVPTTNSVGAENCGTFVANVLQANGIKGIDTQKIYSVFKKPQPQEQGVAEGLIDYAQRKLGLKWGKIGDVVNGSVVAEYLDSQDDSMDTDRYINSKFKLINITANEAEKYREISDLNGWPSDTPLEKVKGWGIDDYKMDRIRKNDVTYQSLMKHTPVVSSRGFIINGNHRVARALEMGIDPIPILKELQQGVAEGTEKVNQLTNALISFYKPVFDQIEPGAVDNYVKQAKELLNQAPDPTIRDRMREIFKKGQKDPMIQGGVVTAIAAILTGGLLSSASRMGLSPAQTNILLQAVLNTVIPTIIARINNKTWSDTIKYTLASVGVGMTAAATLSEKRVTEGLSIDVPNEQWLQDKIDYAKSKGRDEWGAPFFGSTTAYARPNPQVSVVRLELLKGMRNEQNNVREKNLEWLKAYMEKTGKLPPDPHGNEYAPYVMVAYNGEAWVNEGNHRIMAAFRLGPIKFGKTMPVQLAYFDGGERVESGIMYPGKIGLGRPAAKPVREAYTGPQLKWLKPGELRGSYTDQQLRDRGFNRTGTGKWFILLSRWNELIAKKGIQ